MTAKFKCQFSEDNMVGQKLVNPLNNHYIIYNGKLCKIFKLLAAFTPYIVH